MKRIAIDLSKLKTPHCGLGQVALQYGYFFRDHYEPNHDEKITLLVPKKWVGAFGNHVEYKSIKNIYRLFPWLLGRRYDVWHSTYQLSHLRPWAKRIILTIHDLNFLYEKNTRKAIRYLKALQKEVDEADTICTISQFSKKEIEQHLSLKNKNVEVVYNGMAAIESQSSKQPEKDIRQPFLFTIGEIKEKKNFHVLLDMLPHLPEYHLYIAGRDDTPYAQSLKQKIVRAGLRERVTLLGIIPEEEKTWFYEHCRAFVFPSLYEGFGLPILEAMRMGCPVICSSQTSLKEIGDGHVAFLPEDFDPARSAAIVQNTISRWNESQRTDAQIYANKFSWQKHLAQYFVLYRES